MQSRGGTGTDRWCRRRRDRRRGAGPHPGTAQGLGFVEGLEDEVDNIRSVVDVAESVRRVEVSGLVGTVVDVPADQVLAVDRGIVVPARRPQDPALAVGAGEEGEQLGAVDGAVPADRAVAEGGEGEAAVGGEVDRPGGAGDRILPALRAVAAEGAEEPLRAEEKALTVGGDGEAA